MTANAPRRILFATAELEPYSKVGGLGEVSAGLSAAISQLGPDIRVISPLHHCVRQHAKDFKSCLGDEQPTLEFAGREISFDLLSPEDQDGDAPIYFIAAPEIFEASEDIYGDEPGPYGLGDLKWLFFAAVLMPACRALDFEPDVLHLQDWHSSLAAALNQPSQFNPNPLGHNAARVLTIHNAAFQGEMAIADYRRSGLRTDILRSGLSILGDRVNLLMAGTRFADQVTTVSPSYAKEIRSVTAGAGLEEVFDDRGQAGQLIGIRNGLDEDSWNPETDAKIAAPFHRDDMSGKDLCRDALLEELELKPSRGPVLGLVSRLSWQKGIDLVLDALKELLRHRPRMRVVILGQGDPDLEKGVLEAQRLFPGRVAARVAFDPDLAHRIEAGADIFLMPSRYEPCGLNQMISQRYGTIPVVRATGGLADTVVPYDGKNLKTATGFAFREADSSSLIRSIKRALTLFRRSKSWRRMRHNAMSRNWSWESSAREYLKVFEEAVFLRESRDRETALDAELNAEPIHHEAFLQPMRSIPNNYHQDVLNLMTVDPRRIFAYWETTGPKSRELMESHSGFDLDALRWELRLTNTNTMSHWTLHLDGYANNWFIQVDPGHDYEAELWVVQDGQGDWARKLAGPSAATTPPEPQ